MLLSMICWGSWANTQKADSRWRFELFYLDYNIGLLACALLIGLTLGNLHPYASDSFFANLRAAGLRSIIEAIAGGIVFTIGNLLLVAAISIAGMSVAFPVGSGLGLVIGAVLNYLIAPSGNPLLIFSGIALVCVAIALDALAYRAHSKVATELPSRPKRSAVERPATATPTPAPNIAKGLILSIFGGIGAGLFYPFVARSLNGPRAPQPHYTVNFVFAIGAAISAIPVAYIFMRKPVTGAQLSFKDYFARPHLAPRLGNPWRPHLGDRHRSQLRRLLSPHHRPRDRLRHGRGQHHDLRSLGRLRLARVPQRHPRDPRSPRPDVPFLPPWPHLHRARAHLPLANPASKVI